MTTANVTKGRNALEVHFEYDESLVAAMRSVPGHEFNKTRRVWRFPLDILSAEQLGTAIRGAGHALEIHPDAVDWARDAKRTRDTLRLAREARDSPLLYEKADLLYPFQRVAVSFLANRGGGLLGDEMGLGKTPMSIAAIREMELRAADDFEAERGEDNVINEFLPRYLVVCPNSKRLDWEEEIGIWYTGSLPVWQIGRTFLDEPGWHIVNWEKLIRRPELLTFTWDAVIGDESHRMKNKATKQSIAMRKIRAKAKMLLSGTPIKNVVVDLWPQLQWLEPERWPSYWRFFERYVDYDDTFYGREIKGVRNTAELQERLATVMVARRTEDVELELPSLVVKTVAVELEKEQRTAYNRMRDEFVAWLEGEDDEVSALNWLSQALRLKQIAGSLGIFYPHLDNSAKLDAMEELLDEAPSSEKFVVMSQFRGMVDQATARLRKLRISYCEMTGQSCLAWHPDGGFKDVPSRHALIQHFQESDISRVFIATTQTGGEGITLTAARYFVFLDLLWTPADNEQAMKRVHRIGQGRKVVVYRLLAKDTIDFSAILPTLRGKRAVIDAVMRP